MGELDDSLQATGCGQSASLDAWDFVRRCQVAIPSFVDADVASIFAALWSCRTYGRRWHTMVDRVSVSSALLRLAVGLQRRLARPTAPPGSQPIALMATARHRHVVDLLDILSVRYCQPHATLAELARVLRLPYSYLSRALLSETGHHYAVHLNGLRMFSAAILLRSTGCIIKEVSAHVGYQRTGELDRHCMQWFGMTPQEFRRSVQFLREVDPATRRGDVLMYVSAHRECPPSEVAVL